MKRDSDGRWLSGQSGNPFGRKPGSVDKRTTYRRAFEANAPDLIAAVIRSALEGDAAAQRICIERLVPPLKATDAPVTLPLNGGLGEQGRQVLQAVADGEITPSEAESLFRSISAQARVTEVAELEKRIEVLECEAV